MWNQPQQQQRSQGYSQAPQQPRPAASGGGYAYTQATSQQQGQPGQQQQQLAQQIQQAQQQLQSALQQAQTQLASQYAPQQPGQPVQSQQQQPYQSRPQQQYQPGVGQAQQYQPASQQYQPAQPQPQQQQQQQYQPTPSQPAGYQQAYQPAGSQYQPTAQPQQQFPGLGGQKPQQAPSQQQGYAPSTQQGTTLFGQGGYQAQAPASQPIPQTRQSSYEYGGFQQPSPPSASSSQQYGGFGAARQAPQTAVASSSAQPQAQPQQQQQAQQQAFQLLAQRLLQDPQQTSLLQQLTRQPLDPSLLQAAVASVQQQQQPQPTAAGTYPRGGQQPPPQQQASQGSSFMQQRLPQQQSFQQRPGGPRGGGPQQDFGYGSQQGFGAGRADRPATAGSMGGGPAAGAPSGFSRAGEYPTRGFSGRAEPPLGGRPDRITGFSGPAPTLPGGQLSRAATAPLGTSVAAAGAARPRDSRDVARARAAAPGSPTRAGRPSAGRRDREKDTARRDEPPRKSRRSPLRREESHKRASRSISVERDRSRDRDQKKYQFKVSPFTFAQQIRGYLDVKRRYPRLHVSQDFTQVVCCWAVPGMSIPDISHPVKVLCEAVSKEDSNSPQQDGHSDRGADGIHYSAKVVLMSGSDSTSPSAPHLSHLLKFLVCKRKRERSELLCIGGPWSASLDGGEPSDPNSPALINAAIRWTKDQTQLDLSGSTQWFRFMEIFYDRPETPTVPRHTEVVVFFVPDTASTLPNTKDWKEYEKARAEEKKASADHKHANGKGKRGDDKNKDQAQDKGPKAAEEKEKAQGKDGDNKDKDKDTNDKDKDSKDKDQGRGKDKDTKDKDKDKQKDEKSKPKPVEEKMPRKPCLLPITKSSKQAKLRAMMLSLEGLLEYDESDRFETTFEVSLFGELFHEMLQKEFGQRILQALMNAPKANRSPSPDPEPNDKASRKRQRDSSHSPVASAKKSKSSDTKVGSGEAQSQLQLPSQSQAQPVEPSGLVPEETPAGGTEGLHATSMLGTEPFALSESGPTDGVEITEVAAVMEGVEPAVNGDSTTNEIPQVEISGIESTTQGGTGDAMQDIESPAQDFNKSLESAPPLDDDLAAHVSMAEVDASVDDQEQQSNPPTMSDGDPLVAEVSASELPATAAAGVDDAAAPSAAGVSETTVATGDKEKIRLAKESKRAAEEREKDIKSQVAKSELVRAFRYFDRSGVGYLKNEDVEALLHCLDAGLSRRFVHSLVNNASDIHERKLVYSTFCEKLFRLGVALPPVGLDSAT